MISNKNRLFYLLFLGLVLNSLSCSKSDGWNNDFSEVRSIFKEEAEVVNQIKLEISNKRTNDFIEIKQNSTGAKIVSNSQCGLCKGISRYLERKHHYGRKLNSSNFESNLDISNHFDEVLEAPAKLRLFGGEETYDNTFWWEWEDWDAAINFAATQGYNAFFCPLIFDQALFQTMKRLGLKSPDLEESIPGLIAGSDGRTGGISSKRASYMPSAFRKKNEEIQRKIIKKLNRLGMKPVAPAFNGYISTGYILKHPSLNFVSLNSNPPGAEKIYRISWFDPSFIQISNQYMAEATKLFGTINHWLFTPINRQTAHSARLNTRDLENIGIQLSKILESGPPNCEWIINTQPCEFTGTGQKGRTFESLFNPTLNPRVVLLEGIGETNSLYFYKAEQRSILNFGQRDKYIKDRSSHLKKCLAYYKESFAGSRTIFPQGIAWSNSSIWDHHFEASLIGDFGWGIPIEDSLDLGKKYVDGFGLIPDKFREDLKVLLFHSFNKNSHLLDVAGQDRFLFQEKTTLDLAVSGVPVLPKQVKEALVSLYRLYLQNPKSQYIKTELAFYLFCALGNEADRSLALSADCILTNNIKSFNKSFLQFKEYCTYLDYVLNIYFDNKSINFVDQKLTKTLGKSAIYTDNINKYRWLISRFAPLNYQGDTKGLMPGINTLYIAKRWQQFFSNYLKYSYLRIKKINALSDAWESNWVLAGKLTLDETNEDHDAMLAKCMNSLH